MARERARSETKKLIGAAEYWATGDPNEEIRKELVAKNAPQEVIDSAAPPLEPYEVFEENWTTVEIFQRLATQWVWSFGGDRIGFNYQSMEFLFKLYRVKNRKEVFEDLQLMEISSMRVWRKRDEEKK